MTQILLKSGAFIFIIILGWTLKTCGLFGRDDHRIISKILLNVALPATIITSFSSIQWTASLLLLPLIGFAANWVQIGLGRLLAGRKAPVQDRLLYMFNSSGYNIGAFAIPFVQSYFGPGTVVGMYLLDVGNGLMCTGANYAVVRSFVPVEGEKLTGKLILKRMFGTATFPSYLFMMIYTLLGGSVPAGLVEFISPAARATPFLAMLMVGMMFEFHPRREYLEPIAKIMGLRLAMGGVIAALALFVLPLPREVCQALAVVAFAPISVVSPAFTAQCGGNAQLAGCINSCSIVVGIAMMLTMLSVLGLA